MPKIIEDDYLGDGVYASFDGYQILLDLRGQPGCHSQSDICRIALDEHTLDALMRYKSRVQLALLAAEKAFVEDEEKS